VIYLQSGFEFAKRLPRNSHAEYVAKVRLDITFNYKKKSGGDHYPLRTFVQTSRSSGLVGQHSLISAAAVLINDSLAGLVIDFIALAAGFGNVFRCCFVTVAQ
jgi:hypothetical protein